jgi:hypothetical protein
MFNFGEFLSISNFVRRAFIKQISHVENRLGFGLESHKEINILVNIEIKVYIIIKTKLN